MISKTLDKKKLAKDINTLETGHVSDEWYTKLAYLHYNSPTPIIGFIGAPGVGKSTLIGSLLPFFIKNHASVGALLVDPASEISGSALLGDKLRIHGHVRHPNIFIRSESNALEYGGISLRSYPSLTLMRDHVDLIIVEAVGGGQRQSTLAYLSDILVYCLSPFSGDSIQLAKSGNMEFPAIHIITKSDTTKEALLAAKRLKIAKKYDEQAINNEPFHVSHTDIKQIEHLCHTLIHRTTNIDPDTRKHHRQKAIHYWLKESIKTEFGTLRASELCKDLAPITESPFDFRKNIINT